MNIFLNFRTMTKLNSFLEKETAEFYQNGIETGMNGHDMALIIPKAETRAARLSNKALSYQAHAEGKINLLANNNNKLQNKIIALESVLERFRDSRINDSKGNSNLRLTWYTIAGLILLIAESFLALKVAQKFVNADEWWHPYLITAGIITISFMIKVFYEKYLHEKINLASKLGEFLLNLILIVLIMTTLYVLAYQRFDTLNIGNNGIQPGYTNSFNSTGTIVTNDSIPSNFVFSKLGIGTSKEVHQTSFILLSILLPILSGIYLAIAFSYYHNLKIGGRLFWRARVKYWQLLLWYNNNKQNILKAKLLSLFKKNTDSNPDAFSYDSVYKLFLTSYLRGYEQGRTDKLGKDPMLFDIALYNRNSKSILSILIALLLTSTIACNYDNVVNETSNEEKISTTGSSYAIVLFDVSSTMDSGTIHAMLNEISNLIRMMPPKTDIEFVRIDKEPYKKAPIRFPKVDEIGLSDYEISQQNILYQKQITETTQGILGLFDSLLTEDIETKELNSCIIPTIDRTHDLFVANGLNHDKHKKFYLFIMSDFIEQCSYKIEEKNKTINFLTKERKGRDILFNWYPIDSFDKVSCYPIFFVKNRKSSLFPDVKELKQIWIPVLKRYKFLNEDNIMFYDKVPKKEIVLEQR